MGRRLTTLLFAFITTILVPTLALTATDGAANNAPDAVTPERQKALDALKNQLRFAHYSGRNEAISRIARLEKDERDTFHPLIIELTEKERDARLREAFIRHLSRFKAQEAAELFIASLNDDNIEVQRAAISGLGNIKAEEAATNLLALLEKQEFNVDGHIVPAILQTMGRLKVKDAIPLSLEKLDATGTTNENRRNIALYLGDVESENGHEQLITIAKNIDADVLLRAYSVNALGRAGATTKATELLEISESISAITDGSERTRLNPLRLHLISALIRLGEDSVIPEIIEATRDDEAMVRLRAIEQIGELRITDALDLLNFKKDHDPSRRVREAAKKAIDKIEGRDGEDGTDGEDNGPAEN